MKAHSTLQFFICASIALAGFVECVAQQPANDPALTRKIRKTPLWKKQKITEKELSQFMRNLRSGKVELQKEALLKLANSRPIPRHTQTVMAAVKPIERSEVDWIRASYYSICTHWKAAEDAAVLVQRAGSYERLGQVIAQGGVKEKFDAINALSHTDDPKAADVLAAHFNDGPERLKIAAAFKDMGPIAAPSVMKLTKADDWRVQVAALNVMEDIGTKQQLPELQKLTGKGARGIVSLNAKRAIEEIKKSGR